MNFGIRQAELTQPATPVLFWLFGLESHSPSLSMFPHLGDGMVLCPAQWSWCGDEVRPGSDQGTRNVPSLPWKGWLIRSKNHRTGKGAAKLVKM